MRVGAIIAVFLLLWPFRPALAETQDMLWQALRQGRAVALIRHAEAPGIGDPADFRLDDCVTQRNLSEAGRNQARQLGNLFRRHGIDQALVLTSAWCRARDTAALLDLGRPEVAPALASLHGRADRREAQVAELRALIGSLPPNRALVLVSHQATIAALVNVHPGSGEIVVVDRHALKALGRLPAPQGAGASRPAGSGP